MGILCVIQNPLMASRKMYDRRVAGQQFER